MAWALYFTLWWKVKFLSGYTARFSNEARFSVTIEVYLIFTRDLSHSGQFTQYKHIKYWGQAGWYTFKMLPLHTSLFSAWGQKIIGGTCPGRWQSASNLIACTDTDWTKKIDLVFRYEKRWQSDSDFTCSTPEIHWAKAPPQHIKHFFLNILPKPHRSESIQGHLCSWISQFVIRCRF